MARGVYDTSGVPKPQQPPKPHGLRVGIRPERSRLWLARGDMSENRETPDSVDDLEFPRLLSSEFKKLKFFIRWAQQLAETEWIPVELQKDFLYPTVSATQQQPKNAIRDGWVGIPYLDRSVHHL
ncbi:Vacuolar protein sorting-associated protein 21 [Ophidiomyces ophidiicola]|nr:Vacuolar protein sorting-associated protein 21 [Ophidiomyces ophidiicola]KAI1984232.1 Vacuolar protein sorting-associated protein 21 [Ophidiomyces ophidiicola]KAI1985055.1 Vacuolar protein sorting-associated protein 21 [Ophidiomyces ophidiicola]KAI1998677.1 Vacuolar protein sorting-associated protein 21 [Ophidiomyces ophidiicola]